MKSVIYKVEPNKLNTINPTEDTQYILSFPDLTEKSKYEVEVIFKKPGVTCEILSIYTLKNGQSLDLVTSAIHEVVHTSCDTNVRGVLYDGSKSSYIGKIIINEGAQQTSSFLDDAVLVLGENVVNRADPILEIEANDVKASHGSTTGRVDEEQLYYLNSRGLTTEEAQAIIVEGYFEAFLSRIVDETVRTEVKNTLL